MNLDKLERIYHDGFGDEQERTDGKGDLEKAGLRRVVYALREDFAAAIAAGIMEMNGQPDAAKCFEGADELIEHILAEASDVKAAGGPTREDGHGEARVERAQLQTPAADPPQCVWTKSRYTTSYYVTPHGPAHYSGKLCPVCGLFIKFVEVKP
jgi:hypothetical protein